MKGFTWVTWIVIALGIFVVGLAYWCFQDGNPCASSGDGTPPPPATNPFTAVVTAAKSVAATIQNQVTGNADPLQNEDNGLIFGGGA